MRILTGMNVYAYCKTFDNIQSKSHNLLMLIKKLNFDIPDKIIGELIVINTFNMEARYPDEKYDFYKKCTSEFTKEKMEKIGEIILWFKKKF